MSIDTEKLRKSWGIPSEEQVTKLLDKEFRLKTNLIPAEISHIFPFDIGFTIHTEDRTFHGRLNYSGKTIRKDSWEEEKYVDGLGCVTEKL